MQTVMLDANIFDKIARDSTTQAAVKAATESAQIRVIVSPVAMQELLKSPFGGIPEFFPVEVVVDSVAVAGLAIPGLARPGDGNVFRAHIGSSRKGADAVIADSASTYADVFVSEDARCRNRLQDIHLACKCFTYAEFSEWIANVIRAKE